MCGCFPAGEHTSASCCEPLMLMAAADGTSPCTPRALNAWGLSSVMGAPVTTMKMMLTKCSLSNDTGRHTSGRMYGPYSLPLTGHAVGPVAGDKCLEPSRLDASWMRLLSVRSCSMAAGRVRSAAPGPVGTLSWATSNGPPAYSVRTCRKGRDQRVAHARTRDGEGS